MEPEGSLPHSQASATCPYPQPARSSPYHSLRVQEQYNVTYSELRYNYKYWTALLASDSLQRISPTSDDQSHKEGEALFYAHK